MNTRMALTATSAVLLLAAVGVTSSAAAATAASVSIESESTAQILSQKSAEYNKWQFLLNDKLSKFISRQSELQAELRNNDKNSSGENEEAAVFSKMDAVSLNLLTLIKRTEDVTRRVGELNSASLLAAVQGSDSGEEGGLEQRLKNAMKHEIERRDRFATAIVAKSSDGKLDGDNDTDTLVNDDDAKPYMTIEQLSRLFSNENVIRPSENDLKMKFMLLAEHLMEQRNIDEDAFWKEHFEKLPRKLKEQLQEMKSNQDDKCISAPSVVKLVASAVTTHYHDGGTNMMDDMASYENGGSVVYELTSAPYQPPPRNNQQQQQQTSSSLSLDKEMERMYYKQKHDGIIAAMENIDFWGWYTNFKFDSLRKYLPDDWERLLDRLSSSSNWGEYTPRGVIDALIPDYVYHAFGISNTANYGSVYGRTASPEVAITAGYSKVGGGGGWSAKVLGNCYPLSMRPENDPILLLLSRHTYLEDGVDVVDEDVKTSFLAGPKYTVRLPSSIYIDAVSVEHRAFPLPQSVLAAGVRGGESAPRWFRVVGFPPCDLDDYNHGHDNMIDVEEKSGCVKLGFDINRPIDLGSFEYYPVRVSGREDDYGGGAGSNEKSKSDRRRRSIQTFAVKGGKVKELGEKEEKSDNRSTNLIAEELEGEEEIPAGSCAPPKELDEIPSCGEAHSSAQSERQLVSAVSFIIEENWGNNEYTCLYRVRVHGDSIQV